MWWIGRREKLRKQHKLIFIEWLISKRTKNLKHQSVITCVASWIVYSASLKD